MPKFRIYNPITSCAAGYNSEFIILLHHAQQDIVQNFRKHFSTFSEPKYHRGQGFTLIELLIVVAIIGILAVILLANYSNFGARQEVKGAALSLKSNLRKYQTYAISGQKRPDPGNAACVGLDLLYYSIAVDSSGYTPSLFCGPTGSPTEVTLPTVGWPTRVTAALSCSGAELRFYPVNQGTGLFCGGGAVSSVTVTVQNLDSSVSYPVIINQSGEIQ